jgi:heptosyltransferase II
MNDYKNILIVRTDRIGDVVLTTPVIRALRKHFPSARITMLVAQATRDLVEGNPSLSEVLVDDRAGLHRGPRGFLKLVSTVRNKAFDCAIIFHTKRRTNLLCFLAGIPDRVGYANNKFGFLLTRPLTDTRHLGEKHESEYCLDVLRAMGIGGEGAPEFYLPLQKSAEEWVEQFLRIQKIERRDLIAIHPGASCPTKQWTSKRFAELMAELRQRYGSQFVLIGADNIKPVCAEIAAKVPFPVIDLAGKTSVGQTVSLLKRCRLLISNDSGPVHLADALGTPVISIFTRDQPGINPERWQPLGARSRTVVTPFRGQMSFAHKHQVSQEYLELIPAKAVLEAVDGLFKLC